MEYGHEEVIDRHVERDRGKYIIGFTAMDDRTRLPKNHGTHQYDDASAKRKTEYA